MDVMIGEEICQQGEEAVVTAWLYDDGDSVEEGAAIAEIMIEKAQMEFPAPASGILRIRVPVERAVTAGDVIATID